MKNALLYVAIACTIMAANVEAAIPPYLSNVRADDWSLVHLNWNRNSNKQILVYQKKDGEAVFSKIRVLDKTVTYDSVYVPNLVPETKYYFKLKGIASDSSDTSDFSNTDSTTTTKVAPHFETPDISWAWDPAAKKYVIKFTDNCTTEKGFRIYLASPGGAFSMVMDTISPTPYLSRPPLTVSPAALAMNKWHIIRVSPYTQNDVDTMPSREDTCFTMDVDGITATYKRVYLKARQGAVRIYYNGFSEKIGDTVVISQKTASDSTGTLIDVRDPQSPAIVGTCRIQPDVKSDCFITGASAYVALNRGILTGTTYDPYDWIISKYKYENGFRLADTFHFKRPNHYCYRYGNILGFGRIDDSSFVTFIDGGDDDSAYHTYSTIFASLLTVPASGRPVLTPPVYFCKHGVFYSKELMLENWGVFGGIALAQNRTFESDSSKDYFAVRIQDYRIRPKPMELFLDMLRPDQILYDRYAIPRKKYEITANSSESYILADTMPTKINRCFIDSKRRIASFLFDDSLVCYSYDTVSSTTHADRARFEMNEAALTLRSDGKFLSLRGMSGDMAVRIIDARGRTRFRTDRLASPLIPVSRMGAGVYTVIVTTGNRTFTARFVMM